jgi:cysteinyl-tRNA synthetase
LACGGIDNLVRHHDYTIAITEAVSGKQFSRFWLHGGHLLVEGEKMSKSKGNVVYPRDLTCRGYSGAQIRFFLIYGFYREKLNFTFDRFAEVSRKLDEVRGMVADLAKTTGGNGRADAEGLVGKIAADFESHLNNNLDVAGAFDSLTQTLQKIHEKRDSLPAAASKKVIGELRQVDSVLQCLF